MNRDALVLGIVTALFLALIASFSFICDDAFISFRYARNWAEGHGLRYNIEESPPVEGFSNFAWVTLAAVVERLDWDVTLALPIIRPTRLAILRATHLPIKKIAIAAKMLIAKSTPLVFRKFMIVLTNSLVSLVSLSVAPSCASNPKNVCIAPSPVEQVLRGAPSPGAPQVKVPRGLSAGSEVGKGTRKCRPKTNQRSKEEKT